MLTKTWGVKGIHPDIFRSRSQASKKKGCLELRLLDAKGKSWKFSLQNGSLMVVYHIYHGRICKKDHQINPRKRVFVFGQKLPATLTTLLTKRLVDLFSKIPMEQFLEDNQKMVFFADCFR